MRVFYQQLITYREVQVVTFRATTPRVDTKTEEIVVSEVSKGPVEGGGTADYEQHLDIPPLPPSNLANCNIIDLEYNLKVQACVEGWLVFFYVFYKFNLSSFFFMYELYDI